MKDGRKCSHIILIATYTALQLELWGEQNHQTPVHQIVVKKKKTGGTLPAHNPKSSEQLTLGQINEIKIYAPIARPGIIYFKR